MLALQRRSSPLFSLHVYFMRRPASDNDIWPLISLLGCNLKSYKFSTRNSTAVIKINNEWSSCFIFAVELSYLNCVRINKRLLDLPNALPIEWCIKSSIRATLYSFYIFLLSVLVLDHLTISYNIKVLKLLSLYCL